MDEIKISDELLDVSYKILMYSMCNTENERGLYRLICDVCERYDLSVRKYMMAFDEMTKRLQELENNDVKD